MKMFLAKLAFWFVMAVIAISFLYALAYVIVAAIAAVVATWLVIKIITIGGKNE